MRKIGVVGASGLVGEEVVKLLSKQSDIKISIFSRNNTDFKGLDALLLCTPAEVSLALAPIGMLAGVPVIDLSSAFRREVPLILSEVNGHLLEDRPRLIACPNCIVAILLMVLGPLHKHFEITKIGLSTYQAASGAGKEGLLELQENRPPKVFPHPLAYNLFLHESPKLENGYSEEEEKIIFETKKILNAPEIGVNVRSIRVPVLRAHSIAANVSFKKDPTNALSLLEKANGISFHHSPTPKLAEYEETVFYGSVRKDLSNTNTLDLWIVGDQLLRGAALTACEIADKLTIKIALSISQ